MNKDSIEYLAYLLDKAKQDRKDNAIFFLGAGASVSAGIPLTHVIVRHIKLKFRKNPIIKQNTSNDYYQLMGALTADERRDLFHYYVTRDNVKLNIANVYLAQLLKLGYVDYIVTVNFDDLILKACTLFNFLPPVYDISNIKTITTTDIRTNSVIYLHGQYFGQWLLNNEEELRKVEDEILGLFNTIKTRRTWVVVGYSGNDGIFEKIKALGSFSNDLFWVKKQFNPSDDKHVIDFLETPNVNAHRIEGYYADSFFLKLHAELNKLDSKLNAPDIFYKPFSFLKSMMQNVNDLNENDDLSKQTANLIEVCNNRISKAIDLFEKENTIETLEQNIINAIIKGEFNNEQAKEFEDEINANGYINVKEPLSWYFNYWGSALSNLARQKGDKSLFIASFEKYQKASELNPTGDSIYNNWGSALYDLAKQKGDESLFIASFEKYQKASELNPTDDSIYNNWGSALCNLAKQKGDESLFIASFEKYQKASELNPTDDSIYYNWGIALYDLAKQKGDESLFIASFEKYQKASELNPTDDSIYNNWGSALSDLAKQKGDESLFIASFEIYQKASELNPTDDSIYYNWGTALSDLAKQKGDEALLIRAVEILKRGVELGGEVYNLACLFAIRKDKNNALAYLEKSLINKEISIKHIEEDDDWKNLKTDIDFINLLDKYR
jgi:Flp pilus assembly protein TadD